MFKQCTLCGWKWEKRDEFLTDPGVKLVGYQVRFFQLTTGLFLFNHLAPDCLTTLAIPAGQFEDLYHGPVFQVRVTGTKACPGHCQRECDLEPCPQKCECAYVREIIQIVRTWPKHGVSA